MDEKYGSGTITKIVPDFPFVEYEYSWIRDGVEQKAKYHLANFSDEAKASLSKFKIGDMISITYIQTNGDKKCLKISEKTLQTLKPAYDPGADARRQTLIVRQSCLDRAVSLWTSVKPEEKKSLVSTDIDEITSVAAQFEKWVMRE